VCFTMVLEDRTTAPRLPRVLSMSLSQQRAHQQCKLVHDAKLKHFVLATTTKVQYVYLQTYMRTY
jgi:hypothetical protein